MMPLLTRTFHFCFHLSILSERHFAVCDHAYSSAFFTLLAPKIKPDVESFGWKFLPNFCKFLGRNFCCHIKMMVGRFFHSHSPPRLLTVVGVGAVDGLYGSAVGSVVVVVDIVGCVVVVVVDDFPPSGNTFTS